jgi:hypothetical protein
MSIEKKFDKKENLKFDSNLRDNNNKLGEKFIIINSISIYLIIIIIISLK